MLSHLPEELPGLVTALAVGLLVGLERERRKVDGDLRTPAGIRTFALIALAGAIAHMLGPIALALAGAFVVLGAIVSYQRTHETDPGLTTEIAMVLVFLLGALALERTAFAAAIGVVATVVLAAKSKLHAFVQRVLTEQELHDALLLAACALVVLPLLPAEAPDPWGVLNPRKLWMIVVLVMAINAAGYVALRAFGARIGLAIAGFTGGFVSSTATIGSMGSRARSTPKLLAQCVSAALMSNVATVVQLAIVVGALSLALLRELAPALVAAGLAALLAALVASWRSFREPVKDSDTLPGRAFNPWHALLFAAIVGVVLLVAAWVNERFGGAGTTIALAAAGLADAHAPAASAAQLVAGGQLDAAAAVIPVLAAFSANSLSKLVVGSLAGGWRYAVRLVPGIVVMNAAFAAVVLWF